MVSMKVWSGSQTPSERLVTSKSTALVLRVDDQSAAYLPTRNPKNPIISTQSLLLFSSVLGASGQSVTRLLTS